MHRAYNSILPTHNRLLQKRWDDKYYREHRAKLERTRSVVDTRAPSTHLHLHLKLKKLQLEEERLATIERDNRILLEKMSAIMRTRGRIDNRNDYRYRSMNREKRERELVRVTRENREILRRILARQPEYSVAKWEEDWQRNLAYMDSISSFPRDWWKTGTENVDSRAAIYSRSKSLPSHSKSSPRKLSRLTTRDRDNLEQEESSTHRRDEAEGEQTEVGLENAEDKKNLEKEVSEENGEGAHTESGDQENENTTEEKNVENA